MYGAKHLNNENVVAAQWKREAASALGDSPPPASWTMLAMVPLSISFWKLAF